MNQAAALDPPLRPLEALRAVGRLLRNPEDTRQVFTIISALRGRSGRRLFERFRRSSTGATVLADQRRLLDWLNDQDTLSRLPEGSLGNAYYAFMHAENLSAAGLVEASDVEDQEIPPQARLFRERMRDMHDLNHTLTGYGREPLGELCLLAFMYRQTGNVGNALIALMATRKFPKGVPGRAARKALFEGFRNGARAPWVPGLDWESMLSENLKSLRARLGVPPASAYQAALARGTGCFRAG
jgi:ubiquinone biosynthesis protein COQ4